MREMKDSGVSYVGDIPITWNVTRNKNVFSCSKDIVGSLSDNTQLLSLTTKGIKEKDINNAEGKLPESFDTYQVVKEDDIVMCLFDLDMSAVFSGISPYNGMISPAYKVLTCKNGMLPKYADYWFQYVFDNRKFSHYAKNIRYTLNYEDFSALPIVLPPFKEQQHMVDYLDKKCNKIDIFIAKQQNIIERLKAYKLSFINESVNNNIGTKCHLGYIGTMKNGLNFSSTLDGEKIKFLGVGDFKDYFILNDINMFSDILTNDEVSGEYMLRDGDIIFVRSNGSKELVGRAIMVKDISYPLTYSGFCIRFRNARPDIVDNSYLLYYFRSLDFRKELEKYSQGSNINNVNQELLSQIDFTFPDIELQRKIVYILEDKCKKIDTVVCKKMKLIDKLTTYKKSLIYEVVTGKKTCVYEKIGDMVENE